MKKDNNNWGILSSLSKGIKTCQEAYINDGSKLNSYHLLQKLSIYQDIICGNELEY
jgi:hypothetical protein